MIKLSILVVTYNQEKYIQQCLDSILVQLVDFEYEVIIGDDCSTDSTPQICDEYAKKYPFIHVYHHSKNLGHVKNWEFCLNQCKGEYIAILEGDDYWIDCHKLQKQVDYLDSHSEVALTITNVQSIYEKGAKERHFIFESMGECCWKKSDVCGKEWYILPSSSLFRNVFKDFSFPKEIYIADSYLFPYLLEITDGITYSFAEVMTAYRQHRDNISAKNSLKGTIRWAEQYKYLGKRFRWGAVGYKRSEDMYLTVLSRAIFPGMLRYRWRYMILHPRKFLSRYLFYTIFDCVKLVCKHD